MSWIQNVHCKVMLKYILYLHFEVFHVRRHTERSAPLKASVIFSDLLLQLLFISQLLNLFSCKLDEYTFI